MSGHDQSRLQAAILALSNAPDWEAAKAEWQVDRIYIAKNGNHCLCGKAIKECIVLANQRGEQVTVGNVCVNHFWDVDYRPQFRELRRPPPPISFADRTKLAYTHGRLNLRELAFLNGQCPHGNRATHPAIYDRIAAKVERVYAELVAI